MTPSVEVQGTQQQDVEEDDGLFSVDLEARKAGLRAQLAVFVKVRKPCTCATPEPHMCYVNAVLAAFPGYMCINTKLWTQTHSMDSRTQCHTEHCTA